MAAGSFAAQPRNARCLRDWLYLVRALSHSHSREYGVQTPDAHLCVRNLAGASHLPSHRCPQPAVARGQRIGGKFEGILRAHRMAADYIPRDSARYWIIAEEWPVVKQRLAERLECGDENPSGALLLLIGFLGELASQSLLPSFPYQCFLSKSFPCPRIQFARIHFHSLSLPPSALEGAPGFVGVIGNIPAGTLELHRRRGNYYRFERALRTPDTW